MRGDRVEIVVDAGNEVRTYEIVATRNGRRVEIATGRGVTEVTEVTRSGTPVRTARFMSARVLALVEHPAEPASASESSGLRVRVSGRVDDLEGQQPPEQPHHADLPGDVEQEDHRPPARDGACDVVAGQHEQGVVGSTSVSHSATVAVR